jgi:hypothetical protein
MSQIYRKYLKKFGIGCDRFSMIGLRMIGCDSESYMLFCDSCDSETFSTFDIYISRWLDGERKGGCILLPVGSKESGSWIFL